MTNISRAEGELLGIPDQEFPIFRQYVRDNCRVDLDGLPEAARYMLLDKLADKWLADRSERMSQEALKRIEDTRLQARRDGEQTDAEARRENPEYRRADLIPDPVTVGAVPQTDEAASMPAKPKRRRRRRGRTE